MRAYKSQYIYIYIVRSHKNYREVLETQKKKNT